MAKSHSAKTQPAIAQPATAQPEKSQRGRPAAELPLPKAGKQEAGLALDQLSAALAGMLDAGQNPYAAAVVEDPADPAAELAEEAPVANACEITPRSILEAMLFVGSPQNVPLSGRQVAGLMRGVRSAEIDTLVRELNAEYERRNCPYTILEEAQGYRLALRPEYDRLRDKFHGRAKQARLSQAAIEVLAAVAYHEPVTGEEVAKLRGTPGGAVLAQLVRRQLLRLDRDSEQPRRAAYYTTPRFLELFGLDSLADLPRGQDLS